MFYKKIIGTFVMLLLLVGASLSIVYLANAEGLKQGKNIQINGIVSAKTDNTITIITSGSTLVAVVVDDKTKYTGHLTFAMIEPGDELKINSKQYGSQLIANTVKRVKNNSGYGHQGE